MVDDIKNSVEAQITQMVNTVEMRDNTAEYILGGGDKPVVHYENVKTHKMENGR